MALETLESWSPLGPAGNNDASGTSDYVELLRLGSRTNRRAGLAAGGTGIPVKEARVCACIPSSGALGAAATVLLCSRVCIGEST